MNYRYFLMYGVVLALGACASGERTLATGATAVGDAPASVQGAGIPPSQAAASPTEATVTHVDRKPRSGATDADNPNWPPRLDPEPAEIAKIANPHLTPAARSPAIAPPKWDEKAYRSDPHAYLDESLPGRVNQPATPAADVPFLTVDGPAGFQIAPLSRITLRTRGEPWMPVTFTSFGLGTFVRTGLVTVTVPADGEGIASASWVATAGTVGSVSILAASPTRAGQAQFLIQVSE